MVTNPALDPKLIDQVFALSGEPTKKAAITLALQEFVARHEQRKLTELFGTLDWDGSYDYKAERNGVPLLAKRLGSGPVTPELIAQLVNAQL